MREIIFDTETTGLNPAGGDRMVEIGCIELVNRVETGRTFHAYFNPDRPMPSDAEAVHGLTDIFLSDKPRFAELADQLLEFMGDSPLVAHNAGFDRGVLRACCASNRLAMPTQPFVCSMREARQRWGIRPTKLSNVCRQLGIGLRHHDALSDAEAAARIMILSRSPSPCFREPLPQPVQ